MEKICSNELISVRLNLKKEFIATACFYVFWFMQMFAKGICMTSDSREYKLLTLVSFAFLAVKFLLTEWDFRFMLVSVCLAFVATLTYFLTRIPTLLLTCIAIIGAKDIKLRPLFRYTMYFRTTLLMYMMFGGVAGFVDTSGDTYVFRNITFEPLHFLLEDLPKFLALPKEEQVFSNLVLKRDYLRFSLGHGTPNILHTNLLIIFFLYVIERENKLNVVEYASFCVMNFIFYYWTLSRTSFLLIFGLVFLSVIVRVKWLKAVVYPIGISSYAIMLFTTLVFSYFFSTSAGVPNPTLWQKLCYSLDRALSSRFEYSSYAAKGYPLSLLYIFGMKFRTGWSALDSAYMNLWLRYGFVSCLLFGMGYGRRMRMCLERGENGLFLVYFGMALFGFTEMSFVSVTINIFLLALIDVIYPQPKLVYPCTPYTVELKASIKRYLKVKLGKKA